MLVGALRTLRIGFSNRFMYRQSIRNIMSPSTSNFEVVERGCQYSKDYRAFFRDVESQSIISPFHDIPLLADARNQIFNMVCEIPRWTNAKMEIATTEKLNPIKQDTKKDKIRFVHNIFPHHGYIWNYGAIPQTWEDPREAPKDPEIQPPTKGDNDPIDVCEIGRRVAKRGEVMQVKVLGTLALIDEGETDWKIIAIDVNDPLAEKMNDITDIDQHMPGFLKATREWFKYYKVPAGKPVNEFAFNGNYKPRDYALHVIEETHEHWKNLIASKDSIKDLDTSNTTIGDSPNYISEANATKIVEATPEPGPACPIDPEVDQWHYISV